RPRATEPGPLETPGRPAAARDPVTDHAPQLVPSRPMQTPRAGPGALGRGAESPAIWRPHMIQQTPRSDPRRGAATVELAVLLPLLVTLLLGIWEVGRLIDVTQVLFNGAREGGRLGAVGLVLNPITQQTDNVYATEVVAAVK